MLTDRDIMRLLVERYAELSELCYRISVSRHDERGRFRRRHPGRRPHPALLKKVDLDYALLDVYRRFFGPLQASSTPSSTSNSRAHGSETSTRRSEGPPGRASRSE